jgi:hypothetical protein
LSPTFPHAIPDGAVLLTGATGFVGMEVLARYLERTDRHVVARPHERVDGAVGALQVARQQLHPQEPGRPRQQERSWRRRGGRLRRQEAHVRTGCGTRRGPGIATGMRSARCLLAGGPSADDE